MAVNPDEMVEEPVFSPFSKCRPEHSITIAVANDASRLDGTL
jgi:hypothetical protein